MSFTPGGSGILGPGLEADSRMTRPTGTVTFLFTDIEGSTRRWEEHRSAMGAALKRHDEVMREAITTHGGWVFKTVGDAFCAAFATAPEAIAAALEAQRALQREDFEEIGVMLVRMALHTGTAQERDADYFGPAVNRVARLLAVGHGGQVLVSRTTADLARTEISPDTELRDLGAHQLKDLVQPEHVYQLVAPGLRDEFPALRSLGHLHHNLPQQLTSLVGREEEVDEIRRLTEGHRLVTVVGTGGAGKTRVAIAAGAELLERFDDGVWFVELAPISDPSLVSGAIARALGVRESANAPLLDTLIAYLERRRQLLILDNCEHVIGEVRRVVTAILRRSPGATVLATSRESLNVAGERVFRLPSLAVPPSNQPISADLAMRYGAVVLFSERAQAADPRFSVTDENAPFAIEIATRLDGIPLAIELAAARIKVLSPQQLATRLNERFRLLTGGDRSALPRHQTMRALIDWSFELLSDQERALFARLSIFAGGFTLDSAAAVCGGDELDEIAMVEFLSSLVDKSLVQADPEGDGRYRLLESTRQYGREKLIENGEHAAVAHAHARAFLDLAQRLEHGYNTTSDREWSAQVEPEMENWQAALEWSLAGGGDVALGRQLATTLARAWAFLATTEGRRWIRLAQESIDDSTAPATIASLDMSEASIDAVLGLHKASYAAAERALARYRSLGDALGTAHAQRHAGRGLILIGRITEGEALLREALETFKSLGERILTGATLENIAIARAFLGDVAGARKYYAEALAVFKANNAERLAVAVATNLAEAEFQGGDAEAALRIVNDALAADVGAMSASGQAFLTCNSAAYQIALGRYDAARSSARDALAMARALHYDIGAAWALQHLAAAAALNSAGRPNGLEARSRAARLIGYVDERLAALDRAREYSEQREYQALVAALSEALGPEQLEELMDEGRQWRDDLAISEAMLL
ncbi:MAG TPA: adenylate/guanylate cyclase domain-containing protein [Candidatus Babeliales bacterium]|nr:adenylate/guanylate cyclase domain-containing protein [Candidatus Babeliales bacterium]